MQRRSCHFLAARPIGSLGQRTEALGFHSLWLADHIVIPRQVRSPYPYAADRASPFDPDQPFYEPLSVLNFLAGCTEKVRLGMHVLIVPYRPAVYTAKILASIDALSGGRLIVGVGTGWMEEEFKALGLSTFRQRGAVTNEYLQAYKELWTKDDPLFRGTYVQFSGVGFQPKPMQQPHPPIWVGGSQRPRFETHGAVRRRLDADRPATPIPAGPGANGRQDRAAPGTLERE